MITRQNVVITLIFNLIFCDNIHSYVSKEVQLEGSGSDSDLMIENNDLQFKQEGFDSDLIIANNDFQIKSTLENNFLSQLEKSIDSMLIKHNDLSEKRLQNYMEMLLETKLKTYLQAELRDVKTLPSDESLKKCADDRLPQNCYEAKECRNSIFSLMIPQYSDKPFHAACDLDTLASAWTIIQKRQDGSENFFRNWTDYVKGFGKLDGEFFIGLEKLHALTSFGAPQELYIIMDDFEGTRTYARYKVFKVDSESEEFKLNVEEYSGTAGDSLSYHSGGTFSTKDFGKRSDCAGGYKGGWWYKNCLQSNLNGLFLFGKTPKSKYAQGVVWEAFRGLEYSLKFVQMMIRPEKSDD